MKSKLIDFAEIDESDGSLVFAECDKEIPFEMKRFFYIFGVPSDKSRADHASKDTEFMLIAINGSMNVDLYDGKENESFILNRKNQGLLILRNTWMKTYNFSSDAVLLVMASSRYEDCHYYSDMTEFETAVNGRE